MKIVCDACGAKYSIADEKVAGRVFKIRCKKCSNIIVVRGNANEEAAAAPEEPQPNNDTKVFDYQGYDSPQDAMAAEGEWHLVIDQEQIGPMTSAEVRQRFANGEVDAESYIWKEGFADWERLPDVPEFADLEGGGAAAAAPPADDGGGMFGASDPAAEPVAEQSSPLAAAAAASDLFGGDADLFGGGGDASGGADLFGGGAPVGENTGEVVMSKEAEAQLKGQRNENSVLFSLGNLAALASDSPNAAAAAAVSSSSGGAISNTGGSEGSGLIDIRSMASVYLADKGGAASGGSSTPTGSADDLPVFSQSAFESVSPVLLPTQSDTKLLYTLVGVIAALVVAAAILVVVVLKGGDDDKGGSVAAAEIDVTTAPGTETPTPTAEGKTVPSGETDPSETDPEAKQAEASPTGDPATDPAATDETTGPKPAPKDTGSSRSNKRKEREDKRKGRAESSSTKKPKPKSKPPSSSGGGDCDAVTCLLDAGTACCRKLNKKSASSSSSKSGDSSLPEKLSRGDIQQGISRVKGRVTSCGDKHGGKGTVKVKIKIGGNGKVSSAQASGGGSSLRSCVTSAVKRASFKKTQKGMNVTYPFVFR